MSGFKIEDLQEGDIILVVRPRRPGRRQAQATAYMWCGRFMAKSRTAMNSTAAVIAAFQAAHARTLGYDRAFTDLDYHKTVQIAAPDLQLVEHGTMCTCGFPYSEHVEFFGEPAPGRINNCKKAYDGDPNGCYMCDNGKGCPEPHAFKEAP